MKVSKKYDISFVSTNQRNFGSGHSTPWTDGKLSLCHFGLTSLLSYFPWARVKILEFYAGPMLCRTIISTGSMKTASALSPRIPLAPWALKPMRNLGALGENPVSQLPQRGTGPFPRRSLWPVSLPNADQFFFSEGNPSRFSLWCPFSPIKFWFSSVGFCSLAGVGGAMKQARKWSIFSVCSCC